MSANRRQYERVPLNVVTQIRTATLDAFMASHGVNLSIGGMFIISDEAHTLGDELFFQFVTERHETVIEGLGRVVHVSDGSGPAPAGYGLEFVSMSDAMRARIAELVLARATRRAS